MSTGYNQGRPRISSDAAGLILHNSYPTRVVLRRNLISVGCTDITPDAVREILTQYDKRFPVNDEFVLQP